MKITTGINNFEVLDSGTVLSFKDESINFELTPTIKVIMRFNKNSDIKGEKMDFKINDNTSLEILLTNFENSLGTSNIEPLSLATINNRQVYLNFTIYSVGENSKTIHYTWYSREEVKND